MAKARADRDRPGRLVGGYFVLSTDFAWAIALGGFRADERILLLAAIEKSWSPGVLDGTREPKPFRLRLGELGRALGISRQNAKRAFLRLVAAEVFVPLGLDFGHLIEKDFRTWKRADGSARFTDAQLSWIEGSGIPNGDRIPGDNPDLNGPP